MFADYCLFNMLIEQGWPKSKGRLRKKLIVDADVIDSDVETTVAISVALGAGRPIVAAQLLAEIYENNPWTEDSVETLVATLIQTADLDIDQSEASSPWEALYEAHRVSDAGREVEWSDLDHPVFASIRATVNARGLTWGLLRYSHMPAVFERAKEEYERAASEGIQHGLMVHASYPWKSLDMMLENCDEMITAYEGARGSLPDAPKALLQSPLIGGRFSATDL